jgi:hypothetical protein
LKYLALITVLILAGCRKEEGIWGKLTDDERQYLRDQTRIRCEADAAGNFEDLAANSNTKLIDYERGQYWKVTLSSSSTTRNLRVWKVDGNNVYFLYYDPAVSSNLFIKVNTTVNSEMFEDIRKKKCKFDSGFTITQSSSSFTVKRLDVESTEDSTRYRTDFSHTGSSTTPAFFAYFNVAEAKEKLNEDGDVVSTENLTNKIEYVGSDTDVLYASFASYNPRRFCIIKYTGTAGTIGTDKFYSGPTFPFNGNLICTADGADGLEANTGADPAMNFTSAELVL